MYQLPLFFHPLSAWKQLSTPGCCQKNCIAIFLFSHHPSLLRHLLIGKGEEDWCLGRRWGNSRVSAAGLSEPATFFIFWIQTVSLDHHVFGPVAVGLLLASNSCCAVYSGEDKENSNCAVVVLAPLWGLCGAVGPLWASHQQLLATTAVLTRWKMSPLCAPCPCLTPQAHAFN